MHISLDSTSISNRTQYLNIFIFLTLTIVTCCNHTTHRPTRRTNGGDDSYRAQNEKARAKARTLRAVQTPRAEGMYVSSQTQTRASTRHHHAVHVSSHAFASLILHAPMSFQKLTPRSPRLSPKTSPTRSPKLMPQRSPHSQMSKKMSPQMIRVASMVRISKITQHPHQNNSFIQGLFDNSPSSCFRRNRNHRRPHYIASGVCPTCSRLLWSTRRAPTAP